MLKETPVCIKTMYVKKVKQNNFFKSFSVLYSFINIYCASRMYKALALYISVSSSINSDFIITANQ